VPSTHGAVIFSGDGVMFEAGNAEFSSSIVVFTKVLLDTGNAYDPSTGKFTALYPGLHFFETMICFDMWYEFSIRKNGYTMVESDYDRTSSEQVCRSITVFTFLKTGDIVYVYLHYTDNRLNPVIPNVDNKFGGYLIQ